MKNMINALLIVDIGIVLFCFLSGERQWLINAQVGFITSSLVIFASMISYRNMVEGRLKNGMVIPEDNRDTIDKIEDPYDLFGDEEERDTNKSMQEIVKEEKTRLKAQRRSIWQVSKDSKAAISLYRLGAYGMLIVGFFYLNTNGILHVASYLSAVAIPPVVIVAMLLRKK